MDVMVSVQLPVEFLTKGNKCRVTGGEIIHCQQAYCAISYCTH
jgi:hypothetical protein